VGLFEGEEQGLEEGVEGEGDKEEDKGGKEGIGSIANVAGGGH